MPVAAAKESRCASAQSGWRTIKCPSDSKVCFQFRRGVPWRKSFSSTTQGPASRSLVRAGGAAADLAEDRLALGGEEPLHMGEAVGHPQGGEHLAAQLDADGETSRSVRT